MEIIDEIDLFFGQLWNTVAQSANHIMKPICTKITFLGEYGIIFFATAIILMLFKKTRKVGIMSFGALCFGTLFTNILLKNIIARPRPFNIYPYTEWWVQAGSVQETGYSFPSGHTTAITAFFVALIINKGYRKFIPLAVICISVMAISRNYLMAHYATDVIAGVIVGLISAACSYFVTRFIYSLLDKYSQKRFFNFILNFSIVGLLNKNFSHKSTFQDEDIAENLLMQSIDESEDGNGN